MGPVIAIDLGATNIRVGLVSDTGAVIRQGSSRTYESPGDAVDITRLIVTMVHTLCHSNHLTRANGIGISVAGPVDHGRGSVIRPPNIPLDEIPLVRPLEDEFGLPVRIINDCHAGLLGELYFGEAGAYKNFAYITMSTGIGTGILADGKVLLGKGGNAGETGHFFVDSIYNAVCGCGYPGHWEGYASGRFLPKFFHQWCDCHGITVAPRICTAEDVFTNIRGNASLLPFAEDLGVINARGISNIIVAYEPELIIFDGSVVLQNADLIIPYIERFTDRFLPLPLMGISRLNGAAPLLGASVIAKGYETTAGNLLPKS